MRDRIGCATFGHALPTFIEPVVKSFVEPIRFCRCERDRGLSEHELVVMNKENSEREGLLQGDSKCVQKVPVSRSAPASCLQTASRINVAVMVNDDRLRTRLEHWLGTSDGFQIVGWRESSDPQNGIVFSDHPDVVVLLADLNPPRSVERIDRLRQRHPHMRILAITPRGLEDNVISDLLTAGADGLLDFVGVRRQRFLRAIADVLTDQFPLSARARRVAVEAIRRRACSPALLKTLTKREIEIANLLGQGKLNKEIANDLGISMRTVETHLRHIYRKWHTRSRSETAAKAATLQ